MITTDTFGGMKMAIISLEALGVCALKNAQASEWTRQLRCCEVI